MSRQVVAAQGPGRSPFARSSNAAFGLWAISNENLIMFAVDVFAMNVDKPRISEQVGELVVS
jgi:hypothetical protein